jgi:hypothetical protein
MIKITTNHRVTVLNIHSRTNWRQNPTLAELKDIIATLDSRIPDDAVFSQNPGMGEWEFTWSREEKQ